MFFGKNKNQDKDFRIRYQAIPLHYKLGALILFAGVVIILFFYTENLRIKAIENNRHILSAYARLWGLATTETVTGPAQSIIFEEVIQKADFPLILTGPSGQPVSWRNIGIDNNDTTEHSRRKIRAKLRSMAKTVKPVEINIGKSDHVIGYIYFGEPQYIKWIRLIPVLELFFIFAILLFGLSIYNRIRSYEKQNIWLGMAREMAHQLGTPISSLMGWIEILRGNTMEKSEDSDDKLFEVVEEMDRDIQILSRIVVRFGQIGSVPELHLTEVDTVVLSVSDYLKERIPKLREKVSLKVQIEHVPKVYANELLLSWACENLIKNAIDALEKKAGKINVTVRTNLEKTDVQIIISDNGKGVSSSDQKKIFSPGFTTKKRGWGLGLSLAKRIAEEYHHGKLYLLESHPNEKTTFVIELPIKKT